ncbi:hypothetical protein [Geitlerinema calcuttense]|uniref:Uncharacterized protein n=1 Tax=Geitlerinema calcuttense NRMC-F 0142 TaxID=2922238 RepID=A0ABT7LXS5_9CYAN|nr:hypothetical protein [Geitlerinema calcuttense]MDL5055910.1 hypothetical protein [Geitlerinema calcuttense NRMC-F 0142]
MKTLTRYIAAVLIVTFATTAFSCGKNLQKLQDISDELRIHNRNIAQVTNDFHAEGKISNTLHKSVLTANDKISKGITAANVVIKGARSLSDKSEIRAAWDEAQRILNHQVWSGFYDIAAATFDLPAEIKERYESILAKVRLAFSALRMLLSQIEAGLREERYAE